MGVVYEALDRAYGSHVALKVLPMVSPDRLLRFKREFRAVAGIHHPNMVRLGELVHTGDHWFFTMELVRGVDLLEHVRGPRPSVPPHTGPRTLAWSTPDAMQAPDQDFFWDRAEGEAKGDLGRVRRSMPQLASALVALHEAGASADDDRQHLLEAVGDAERIEERDR